MLELAFDMEPVALRIVGFFCLGLSYLTIHCTDDIPHADAPDPTRRMYNFLWSASTDRA